MQCLRTVSGTAGQSCCCAKSEHGQQVRQVSIAAMQCLHEVCGTTCQFCCRTKPGHGQQVRQVGLVATQCLHEVCGTTDQSCCHTKPKHGHQGGRKITGQLYICRTSRPTSNRTKATQGCQGMKRLVHKTGRVVGVGIVAGPTEHVMVIYYHCCRTQTKVVENVDTIDILMRTYPV